MLASLLSPVLAGVVALGASSGQGVLRLEGGLQRVVALALDDGTVWQVVDPPALGLSTGAVEARLHSGERLRLRRFGGWISGKVERPGDVPVLFRVDPAGVLRWRLADPRTALPCATGLGARALATQGELPAPPTRRLGAEDGSRIDALALYTPAARASAGSTEAMHADMLRWFDETNAVLADSGAVDVVDLITVLGSWGAAAAGSQIDINADGVVDVLDLAAIIDRFGGC